MYAENEQTIGNLLQDRFSLGWKMVCAFFV